MVRTRPSATLAAALAALALPAGAAANPIAVDTTTDNDVAGCSLREAIRSANQDSAIGGCAAGSGADEITLPASANPYILTVTGTKENGSLTGDLDVAGDVTIKGAGADTTTIDGNGTDRVFDFLTGSSTIQDVKITNGKSLDGAPGDFPPTPNFNNIGNDGESIAGNGIGDSDGGGIRSYAALTLTRVTVSGNTGGSGGDGGGAGPGGSGGPGAGGDSTGGNGGSGANGGGIANEGGTLSIGESTIENNHAGGGGDGGFGGTGGEGNAGFNGGTSRGGNGGFGGAGGGVYSQGGSSSVEVTDSTVASNHAGAAGNGGLGGTGGKGGDGGASNGGDGANSFGGDTSAEAGRGGGIYVHNGTSATVTESTIRDNTSGDGGDGGAGGAGGNAGTGTPAGQSSGSSFGGDGSAGGAAGGMFSAAATTTVTRSAVASNSAGRGGDGGNAGTGGTGGTTFGGDTSGGNAAVGGSAGGLHLNGTSGGSVANSTIAANGAGDGGNGGLAGTGPGSSDLVGNGGDGGAKGGVEISIAAGTFDLAYLTIASNGVGAGGTGATAGIAGPVGGLWNLSANTPNLTSSIVANNGGAQCGGTILAAAIVEFPGTGTCDDASINADPLLGALGAHGGPTPTMQLLSGSPAIDGSISFSCPDDQRGVARPKALACDIGAVERSIPVVTTAGASDITATSASVGGTVNPRELPATRRFQFGKTAAYGSQTPAVAAGSGDTLAPATATLTGLTPKTTYHFRLIATNTDGTSTSVGKTFTTAALPFKGAVIPKQSVKVTKKRFAKIKVACPFITTSGKCTGSVSVTAPKPTPAAKPITFGKAKFAIAAGKTGSVVVRVPVKLFAILKRKRSVKWTVSAPSHDARAVPVKKSTKLSFKAPPP